MVHFAAFGIKCDPATRASLRTHMYSNQMLPSHQIFVLVGSQLDALDGALPEVLETFKAMLRTQQHWFEGLVWTNPLDYVGVVSCCGRNLSCTLSSVAAVVVVALLATPWSFWRE